MDLFVYGTLMVPQVMRAVCGFSDSGELAVLHGYCRRLVRGEAYPGIYPCHGEVVNGRLYRGVNAAQSRQLDRFEGDMYRRLPVTVSLSNKDCVADAYVVRRFARHRLTDAHWDLQSFMRDGLHDFVARYGGFSTVKD